MLKLVRAQVLGESRVRINVSRFAIRDAFLNMYEAKIWKFSKITMQHLVDITAQTKQSK